MQGRADQLQVVWAGSGSVDARGQETFRWRNKLRDGDQMKEKFSRGIKTRSRLHRYLPKF